MSTELTGLLPTAIKLESTTMEASTSTLMPGERESITRAVPERRAEFTTARHCARRALDRLGFEPVAILVGSSREPLWPEGVVGSLTHCEGYRAAAVARVRDMLTLGIDAENHRPLPEVARDFITVEGEYQQLDTLSIHSPSIAWDRVLFSAKESVFKAWSPLARVSLDFTDCELFIDPFKSTFIARILIPTPGTLGFKISFLSGLWIVHEDRVFTAAWIPATGQSVDA